MGEETLKVLQMVGSGEITPEDGERLIQALTAPGPATAVQPAPVWGSPGTAPQAPGTAPVGAPRYLRVLVEDNSDTSSPTKVNVRVPMQLLRAGVRLAGLLPEDARKPVNDALHKQGLDVDISTLRPEDLEALVDHLAELEVDVDEAEGTVRVRVFAE